MKYRKVYIEWLDSQGFKNGGWISKNDVKQLKPCKIVSVGFLIKERKKSITLGLNISSDGNVLGSLSIPKFAITKMKEVK